MANPTLHVGDQGVLFIFEIVDEAGAVDLSTASTVSVFFQRPDKTLLEVPGTVTDAINGVVSYTCQAGDFNQAGRWKTQVVILFSNGYVKHSDIGTLTVLPNLS